MDTRIASEPTKPTIRIVDDAPVNVAALAEHLVGHRFSVIITQPDRKNLFSMAGRRP